MNDRVVTAGGVKCPDFFMADVRVVPHFLSDRLGTLNFIEIVKNKFD